MLGRDLVRSVASYGPARHFWETASSPALIEPGPALIAKVGALVADHLPALLRAPFESRAAIAAKTLARLSVLLEVARHIPLYAERLAEAGIGNADALSWDRFHRIRPITKAEMICSYEAFASRAWVEELAPYPTRSSGSSGQTIDILIDETAIAIDTVHGYRQLVLQSDINYSPDDSVAHVYTVPWPLDSFDGRFVAHFISSLVQPQEITRIIGELRPDALTLYPTTLEDLINRGGLDAAALSARLVVTHSEQSSRVVRDRWSAALGVPVLDEYSSEEAARIALELPCGHYHTCDDAVYVEIVDPKTGEQQEPGKMGLVVVTNLLNEAMPFIRYVQGDLAIAGRAQDCPIQWGCLEGILGRRNDAFLNGDGELVPAGALLDATYRAMFENRQSLDFELIQTSPSEARFRHSCTDRVAAPVIATLDRVLKDLLGHKVRLSSSGTSSGELRRGGKRRPIRRTFSA